MPAGAAGLGCFQPSARPSWSAVTTLPRPPGCCSPGSPLATLSQAPSPSPQQIPNLPDWDQHRMAGPFHWGEGTADFATLGAQGTWIWVRPCGPSRGRGTEAKAPDRGGQPGRSSPGAKTESCFWSLPSLFWSSGCRLLPHAALPSGAYLDGQHQSSEAPRGLQGLDSGRVALRPVWPSVGPCHTFSWELAAWAQGRPPTDFVPPPAGVSG